MKLFYSPDYVGAAHAFDTTRKSAWIAESLRGDRIPGVELVRPRPLTDAQLAGVHDPGYIDAVTTGDPLALAESQGFDWDPGLATAVRASTGGAVEAALAALRDGVAGSLSSGLHHARRAAGAGFCTYNGLVLAADAALDTGAGRVLIVDLDAHCGGGTASLIQDDERIWQVDVSVDSYDRYPSTTRVELTEVDDAAGYLHEIRHALSRAERRAAGFGLVLYNAGVDPHQDCAVGGLDGITAESLVERDRYVFDWCAARGLPVAFVLAGGYLGARLDREGLVGLHRGTIAAAAAAAAAVAGLPVH